jgi:mRNA interferase RelE/StbE
VDARILALAEEPRPPGVVKMRGSEGYYRLRVGDYRVVIARRARRHRPRAG